MRDGVLDEAYERMHQTGPEYRGWLSNHGPMVADALVRLGGEGTVHRWLDGYVDRLEDLPPTARPLAATDWRQALGDQRRPPEWLALMRREVAERPWQEVLATWWPRLLPGVIANATHGVIRTGHAVRALREVDNHVRRGELAHALAYWASRWQPVPGRARQVSGSGRQVLPIGAAMDALPFLPIDPDAGIRPRLTQLAGTTAWPPALHSVEREADPARFVAQVAVEALRRFPLHARGDAVMLVHSVTAPAAIALAMPSLDKAEHASSAQAAWGAAATIIAAYRLPVPVEPPRQPDSPQRHPADLQRLAVEHGDAHVIKLAGAAIRAGDQVAATPAIEEAAKCIASDGKP